MLTGIRAREPRTLASLLGQRTCQRVFVVVIARCGKRRRRCARRRCRLPPAMAGPRRFPVALSLAGCSPLSRAGLAAALRAGWRAIMLARRRPAVGCLHPERPVDLVFERSARDLARNEPGHDVADLGEPPDG